jgi:hypothetical protein
MANKQEPLNSRRLRIINQSTKELHDDVDALYENLVEGDFELSMSLLEDIKNKAKLVIDMVKDGHILKPKI